MRKITEIESDLQAAHAAYHAIVEEAPPAKERAASLAVEKLQAELSAAIAEGANPCPNCGRAPHGMRQPDGFEVGCTNCGWFRHTDGTIRDHGARGGMLPRHAVETWNEGPDFWKKKSEEAFVARHGADAAKKLAGSKASKK